MTPDSWETVKKLFEQGCDLAAADRAALLAAPDVASEIRAEVERLLRLHDSAGDGFLGQPPREVTALRRSQLGRLTPGELLADRYAVVRFLGCGGMGEVYEVEDRRTGDSIALKLLNEDLAEDGVSIRRFAREVKLARQISHSNVCEVFDFASCPRESGECFFLTMELLRGDNLAAMLHAQGRFSAEQATPVAEQILAGVAAVHSAGIVHRDLKPSNIMMIAKPDGSREAVITDFGLAMQPARIQSAITGTGGVLGTLDYMAPEQLRGEPVSFRTDIYASGLILYEMLAGAKPFVSSSGIGAVAMRLSRDAPALRKVVPSLKPGWADTIAACLARDPLRRPASAARVAHLLHSPARARIAHYRTRISRRGLIAAVAGPVAVLSLFPLIRRYTQQEHAAIGVNSVVLADMQNASGNPQFDGLTALMRAQLAQSVQFEVVSDSRARQILGQMQRPQGSLDGAVAREVALRHGAQAVASGILRRAGSGFALDLRLEQLGSRPDDVTRTWQHSFAAADARELMARVRAGADWIRQCAGEAEAEIARQSRPPEDLTTSRWEAVSAYSLAVRRQSEGRLDEAITLFREALSQDPEFASAQEQLADLLVSERRYNEGYREWMKAIDLLRKRNVTDRERLRGEGAFYYDVVDWQRAVAAFSAWVARYPKDLSARSQLASTFAGLGRYEEAINQFEECLRISNYYGSRHRLIRLYMLRQSRARAQAHLEAMRASGPQTAVVYNDAWFAFVDGHPDQALERLRRLESMDADEWTAAGGYIEACVHAECGRDAAAVEMLLNRVRGGSGLAVHLSGAEQCLGLASLYLRMNERKQASAWAHEALTRDPGPKIITVAATLLARAGSPGDAEQAARLLEPFPDLPFFDIARARCSGEIDLARGSVRSGLAHLEAAARMSPPEFLTDFLARAHARFGDKRRAAQLYESWLAVPAWLWRAPERELPGVLSDLAAGAASLAPDVPVNMLKAVLRSMPFLAHAGTAQY